MKNNIAKITAYVLSLILAAASIVYPVHAEETTEQAGAFTVTGEQGGWTYENNILKINNSGNYKISGTGKETYDGIYVGENFEGTIEIENIKISRTPENQCAFEVHNTANLILKLSGENELSSGLYRAGLEFASAVSGHLTITSETNGSLIANSGGNAAGIGGGKAEGTTRGDNITISGGTIIAIGGKNGSSGNKIVSGAGIGGAGTETRRDNGGNITITGGTVTAKCEGAGAGIGNGYSGNKSKVTITGGSVTAVSEDGGAGIGSDYWAYGKSEIRIEGGTVTAISNNGKSGIDDNSGSTIITGGSVKAVNNTTPIAGEPTDGNGRKVFLVSLDNQSGVNSIFVDNKDYKIAGNHTDDDSFYLYMPEKLSHALKAGEKNYVAAWDSTDSKFSIEEGKLLAPTPIISETDKTSKTIVISDLIDADNYGGAEYKLGDGAWGTENSFDNLTPDTEYTICARYKGNTSYHISNEAEKTIKTLKIGTVEEPQNLETVYGKKLSDITLPAGWEWVDANTVVNIGTQTYSARLNVSEKEDEYDYTDIDGYNSQNHWVERNLTVIVNKAVPTYEVPTGLTSTYGKTLKDISLPEGFTWKDETESVGNVGNNTFKVTYTPTDTENYEIVENIEVVVKVEKAIPDYEIPSGLTIIKGETLASVKLPEGFAWKDETQKADEEGNHVYEAVFTPEDTEHYQIVQVQISVKVILKASVINHIPLIIAEDKVLNVGDTFNPLEDVTAEDKEDGNLTKDIKIISNTVNTEKTGRYEVVYQVTDSQKASCKKIITVIVEEKQSVPEKTVYKIIKGADQSIKYDKKQAVTITCNGEFSKFVSVSVDRKIVDKKNYTVKDGSTILTFNKEYVESLAAGKHVVRFNYIDGYVETTLEIEEMQAAQEPPTLEFEPKDTQDSSTENNDVKTGDTSNIIFWSVMLIASAIIVLKKEKCKE